MFRDIKLVTAMCVYMAIFLQTRITGSGIFQWNLSGYLFTPSSKVTAVHVLANVER